MYNDNPKNVLAPKKPGVKEPIKTAQLSKVETTELMVAIINAKGEVTRELYSGGNEAEKCSIEIISSEYMNDNKIWTIGLKEKKEVCGFITVK